MRMALTTTELLRPSNAFGARASLPLILPSAIRDVNVTNSTRSSTSSLRGTTCMRHLPIQFGSAGEVVCRGEVRSSNRSRWQKESNVSDVDDEGTGTPFTSPEDRSTTAPVSARAHSEPVKHSAETAETADLTDSKDSAAGLEQLPTTSAAAVQLVSCRWSCAEDANVSLYSRALDMPDFTC